MKKYKVIIEGKNTFISIDGEIRRVGFYATRFIESDSPSSAELKAMEIINDELESYILNDKSDPPLMCLEKIDEVSSFGFDLVPGKGFSWFIEDDSSN